MVAQLNRAAVVSEDPNAIPLDKCSSNGESINGGLFPLECNGSNMEDNRIQPQAAASTPIRAGQKTLAIETETEGNIPLKPNLVKIELSDIEDEIRYWETAVVCFVVGENQLYTYRWLYAQNLERPRHRHNRYGGQKSLYG